MAITINGTIVLSPVTSRATTTQRDDRGFATTELSVTGYSNRARASLAAAKEVTRQLTEMAANVWYRVVYLADSEDSQVDGRYELRGATVTATPATSNSTAALYAITVTLRRLGGGGAYGPNAGHRVTTLANLTVNSYSYAALAYIPVPISGYPLPTTATGFFTRTGADGTMNGLVTAAASPLAFAMSGDDVDNGECKVWDVLDLANLPASWVRVWSADHTFATGSLVAIDNGLVRLGGITGGDGRHYIQAWDATNSAWVNIASAAQDGDAPVIGASGSHTSRQVTIDELSPWRVVVTWTYSLGAAPYVWRKTITLERGKHLAKIVYTPVAAATITVAPLKRTFIVARRTADTASGYHGAVETAASLSTATDAMLMGFNATTDKVLAVSAVSTTAVTAAVTTSEFRYAAAAATSLTVWVGGVSYDAARARSEAEAETLGGGASVIALGGGSGGQVVQLDAAAEQVTFNTLNGPPTGSRVMAWFRIAHAQSAAAANAGNTLKLAIYNFSIPADAATITLLATNATFFPTANTFVWAAVEYNGWNGTDSLTPYAAKNASASAAGFYIDQAVFLTLNGTNYDRPRDLANLALTDQYFWASVDRLVW